MHHAQTFTLDLPLEACECNPNPYALEQWVHQKVRTSCVVAVAVDEVVGVLTQEDIIRLSTGDRALGDLLVGTVVSPPHLIQESDLAEPARVLRLFQQTPYTPFPVVTERGRLVGLVTLESVLSCPDFRAFNPDGSEPDDDVVSIQGQGLALHQSQSDPLPEETSAGASQANPYKSALQTSEAMLHDIISSTKACIVQFKLFLHGTREYVFYSQGSELIFGYGAQVLLEHPDLWLSRVLPEDLRNVIFPSVHGVLQGKTHWDSEFRFWHPDGSIRWIGESCNARWDEQQQCWLVTNVALDITGRKQMEAQLRQSEAELRGLFEAMDDLVLVFDQDGRYLKAITTDTGSLYRPAPELVGHTLDEVFPPPDANRFHAIIRQVLSTRATHEFEYALTIGNQERWFSAKCSPIAQDQVIWVARDISERMRLDGERQQNEASLRRSEAKRRAVLAAMPDLMFRLGADGRYREVINPRPDLEMFFQGCNPIGRRLADLVPSEIANHKLHIKDLALATGELQVYEQQFETADGPRFEEVRVIKSGDDEVLFIIRDISDRKLAEKTLKQQLAAIEAAVDGIGILRDGTYTYLNQSHTAMFGYNHPGELIGKTWRELYSPEEIQRFEQEVFPVLQQDRSWQGEATAQRRDGSTFAEGLSLTLTDDNILICVCRDISELKQAQAQIVHNALHDPLTNLPNRTLLEERLDQAIQRAKCCSNYRYAILFIDLDRFKVINDSLGHLVGDKLLVAIAQRLNHHIRSTDLAVRLGGDEFVLLLEDLEGPDTAIHIAERILTDCQTPLMIDGHQVFTGMSIGIAMGNDEYNLAADLIRDADIAMYRAKQNRQASYYCFGGSMHTDVLERHTLEMELHRALELQELVLHYQPIFNLFTSRVVGFEALVRWNHPTRGFLPPDVFLGCAEESGLIVAIDRWVLTQAGQQLKPWQTYAPGGEPLRMHVNLSAQNFTTGHLLQSIDQVLETVNLPHPWLTIEITENIVIEDIDNATNLLQQLANRQIQTSIDDFGIGYSSLQYLHRLPLKDLKIDRSFVHQIDTSDRDYQMVKTIVGLGQQLNLSIIAEGIENLQQLQLIKALGCEYGQGYLFSRPLPASEVERFLRPGARN